MKILDIYHDSVVDGEGFRSVVFTSGCPHHCPGCHNQTSWDIRNGTERSIDDIVTELLSNEMTDVTLSGGDPLFQYEETLELAKKIKENSSKNIWLYTGYTIEQIKKYFPSIIDCVDTIVDGRFIEKEKDFTLEFRGSSNQCIINTKDIS